MYLVSSYWTYFGEYFKVNRLFQGLCSANSMKLIFTTNWSIYLSIVIHFIFKSSNAILMVGFVLTNFLMQMLKYLIHAKYMQKIHHLQYKFLCTKPRSTICLYIPFHGKLCKTVNIHTLCKVLLQNCYFHQHTSCLYRCMIWIMIYCILAWFPSVIV